MKLSHVFVIMVAMLLTACLSISVEVDPESNFNPSSYQTYAWETKPMAAPEQINRSETYYNIDHYVRQYVNQALADRGFTVVAKAEADFIVEYRFTPQVNVDQGGIISPSDEINSVWDAGADIDNTEIRNHYIPAQIRKALLEVLLVESQSAALLWRVTGVRIIDEEDADEAAVSDAVGKMIPAMMSELPTR